MSFLSNLRLSFEDDELLMEESAEPAEIDVTEVVQAEEDALEVQDIESNIEDEQTEIETQSEVVEELAEQDQAIEEKLETPAEVTPEDVAVAQEAFAFTLGRLANNSKVYKDYRSMKVNHEDAKVDPISALKLHQEGVKEMASRVWESIKAMFARIGAWFKKMWAKLASMFGAYGKKAELLQNEVKALAPDTKLKDTAEIAKKHLAFLAVTKSGKLNQIDEIANSMTVRLPSELERTITNYSTGNVSNHSSLAKYDIGDGVVKDGKDGGELQDVVGIIGFTNNGGVALTAEGIVPVVKKDFDGKISDLPKTQAGLLDLINKVVKITKDKDVVMKQSKKLMDATEKVVAKQLSEVKKNEGSEDQKQALKFLKGICAKAPGIESKSFTAIVRGGVGYVSEVLKSGIEGKAE